MVIFLPQAKGVPSCPFPATLDFYLSIHRLPPNEQYELGWRALRCLDDFPTQARAVLYALDWDVYIAVIFPSRRGKLVR